MGSSHDDSQAQGAAMSITRTPEGDVEYERALRSVDPRGAMHNNNPRMVILDDEPRTVAELGTLQDKFIEPEGE